MDSNGADEAAVERSFQELRPMDPAVAGTILREAKQIFDEFGVTFFLRQGTCLGAIRDNGFIPWDDDLDLGTVIGHHGFTEDQIEPVLAAFRDHGFYAKMSPSIEYFESTLMKSNIRIDWTSYPIIDGNIIHFPGVPIPVHLVTQLKEIEFAGDTFLVPDPPEDYLTAKYGSDWMTPKSSGYEKDILALIPDPTVEQLEIQMEDNAGFPATRVRILDRDDNPVSGASVRVAGCGRVSTDKEGYADFRLPEDRWYSLIINHGSHEEVLYMERLARGITYVYKPDPSKKDGRFLALSQE
jgi:hypothetical protein